MGSDFLFTICCPSCGSVISKSFYGTKTFIHCPKCSAELFYEVEESGTIIRITKEPKNRPLIPVVTTK